MKTGAGYLTLSPANAASAYTGGATVQAGGLTFVGGLVTEQITVMNKWHPAAVKHARVQPC